MTTDDTYQARLTDFYFGEANNRRIGQESGLLTQSELDKLPGVEPLITNTLDQGTLAILAGPPGVGKTFLALDWAASITTHTPWLGRPIGDRKREGDGLAVTRAVYVAAEGGLDTAARLVAWSDARRASREGVAVLPHAVNLLDKESVNRFCGVLDNGQANVAVIDTLARCMVGGDENSARDMGVVVQSLDSIRQRLNDCLIVIHHTGKSGAIRGSSALEGAADTVYVLTGDSDHLRLRRTKRKYGPADDVMNLRLVQHGASCVLESAASEPSTPKAGTLTPTQRGVMDTASDLCSAGESFTVKELRAAAETNVEAHTSTIYRAIGDLISLKLLVEVRRGQYAIRK